MIHLHTENCGIIWLVENNPTIYYFLKIQTYFHWLPGKLVHKSQWEIALGSPLVKNSVPCSLCNHLCFLWGMLSLGLLQKSISNGLVFLWMICTGLWQRNFWWDWNIRELAIIYQPEISMTHTGKIWLHQWIKSGKNWKEDHVGTLEEKRFLGGVWRWYDKLVLLRKFGSTQDVMMD